MHKVLNTTDDFSKTILLYGSKGEIREQGLGNRKFNTNP
jgi:hypothetical protein